MQKLITQVRTCVLEFDDQTDFDKWSNRGGVAEDFGFVDWYYEDETIEDYPPQPETNS